MKSLKNMRVLVTGGAGFIGSHLTEKLVQLGANVSVADNLSRGTLNNLRQVKDKIKFHRVDLKLEKDALRVTKNIDIVFNLAAMNTGVDYDIGRTEYMFEENMLLQMIPIRAAAKNKVKQFIQVSSASIYSVDAMEKRIPTKESDDAGEPERSKLGYALGKKMGENLARWYAQNTTMHTVIARFINVYGSRDNYDAMGHFIPAIMRKFTQNKKNIEVFGSGKQKRSFMHVGDAVNALLLLSKKGKNGEAYNIDPQDEYSVREVVVHIQQAMHLEATKITYNQRLPEGSKRRILDNRKIIDLGWRSQYRLKTALQEIVVDYQNLLHDE